MLTSVSKSTPEFRVPHEVRADILGSCAIGTLCKHCRTAVLSAAFKVFASTVSPEAVAAFALRTLRAALLHERLIAIFGAGIFGAQFLCGCRGGLRSLRDVDAVGDFCCAAFACAAFSVDLFVFMFFGAPGFGAFFGALRDYYARYAGKLAAARALLQLVQQKAPAKSQAVAALYHRWIEEAHGDDDITGGKPASITDLLGGMMGGGIMEDE